MTICVLTLGCKVNECESRSLVSALRCEGHEVTEELSCADAYVLNTCSVTSEADRKSRQLVGKARKANPNGKIIVCGCSSQNNPSVYEKYDGVTLVAGNGRKAEILQLLHQDGGVKNVVGEVPTTFEELPYPSHEKTRDYVRVQDGCNNFCSYCIIPYVRGRSRSRALSSVLAEAKVAATRTKEIVLTGIDVSSYGKDISSSLTELVTALGAVDVRKRLSSFECNAITDELVTALAEAGFCDHFHLSLQSGSDSVLKAMNRHYTAEKYYDAVCKIRKVFPNAGITTDVITGFPTESEKCFEETCDFVRRVGFSDLHIFPYSERKGTRAVSLPQIDVCVRRERASVLGEIKAELKRDFLQKQIGKTLSVYFEEKEGEEASGYATNYVKVYADKGSGIADVKITKLYKKGVK